MTSILIFDLLIGMLFISGISMAAVGLYARRFTGRVPSATPFILMMFCAAAWSVLYALDLLTTSLPIRVFYHNLRFLVLPFFSILELWLVIAYVKRTEWLRRDWALLALIIPVAAVVLALTSPYHTLFRYNFFIDTTGPVPVLHYSESIFFQIYSFYSLILLTIAIVLLITETWRRSTFWEMPTFLLLMALAFPTVLNYLFQIYQMPFPGVNLTPAILWIMAILYAIALFRYRFLDIVPIARSRLIEALSKPVLVLDINGRIIDMNPAASSLFSIMLPSALGKPVEEMIPDWPDFLVLCRVGTAQKKDLVRTKDGHTHYFIGSGEPLLTHGGDIEGHLIFLHDVTDQKNAEAALRESEEKYRSIINEMQDMFYRTDLAGKITMLSPSAAKLAGYDSISQILGRNVSEVYADPADRSKLLSVISEKGSVNAYPLCLKTRDGSTRYVTTSSHFYRDAGGNIQGVEGVIHDITDQRRAEEAVRMANKKLNLLSSITRHDIRNQLMALMAFLELSLESIDNPAELADFLKKNQKIAETIARQITFTKEYEDLGMKAPSWQNVSTGVTQALDTLPLKKIHAEVETGGLEIFADPLVEKVFYNLIDNSLRYGGEAMTTIHITAHTAGTELVLAFEDDGAGIPADEKTVIFDKGFGKNTGLGLYLSREILSITGITIAETGLFGKGARFEMTVPAGGFRHIKPDA
jgi:PAS domain S-box-containing protein